jgi:hypothetical protein
LADRSSELEPDDVILLIRERGETDVLAPINEPQLDQASREVGFLSSLRPFLQFNPGAGFTFYELFPHIAKQFIFMSMGNDGLRPACLAMATITRDISLLHQQAFNYYSKVSP